MITSFIAAIFSFPCTGSLVVYRTLFYRLNGVPGPLLARVTKLWHLGKILNTSNHLLLDELHKQYGDFVRTGPNEVTISAPEAVLVMDGFGTKCTKAECYDFLLLYQSIQTTRSKAMHSQRRRIWDSGYSTRALRNHEDLVMMHAQELNQGMAASSGNVVDASTWFYAFGFDVMGDLTLTKSFHMLETNEWHHVPRMLRKALTVPNTLSPVPWLHRFLFSMRALAAEWNATIAWCSDRTKERISNISGLQALPYLNGFINEALRLYPPIPTGGLRVTPPEGITVASRYIPGDVTIASSRYTIGRLKSCYERADEFIPERWSSAPQMVKNKAAFSTGNLLFRGYCGTYGFPAHLLTGLWIPRHVWLCWEGAGIDGDEMRHRTPGDQLSYILWPEPNQGTGDSGYTGQFYDIAGEAGTCLYAVHCGRCDIREPVGLSSIGDVRDQVKRCSRTARKQKK